jgi:L-ascorbate metabolism protein UlaG (beta-lactamase superfamily)
MLDSRGMTMIDQIQWLGHGSFIIQTSPLIYINPWRVARNAFHADVILISHDHYDHCSLADVDKLRGPHTLVIGNERVAAEIGDCMVIRPWQSLCIDRVGIKAVPAYSPDDWRHPLSDGGLGFIISVKLYDIYYAGDTEIIPEMADLHPDIAILPIDGRGTMNVDDAAHLVERMRPRWVIPSNWGTGTTSEGSSRLDALAFKQRAGKTAEVVLLPQIV